MKFFLGIVWLFVELLLFLGAAMFIGLWWTPDFVRGNSNASLLNATLVLMVAGILFHKHVWVLSRHHTPFHFYFYLLLAICTVLSYLYGILFRWI